MADAVFFYGTLMARFNRPVRRQIDEYLTFRGAGSIAAMLFDLGAYPAAVPSIDSRVRGEVYGVSNAEVAFRALDEFEGYRPDEAAESLYVRVFTPIFLDTHSRIDGWVYF